VKTSLSGSGHRASGGSRQDRGDPPESQSQVPRDFDRHLYKARHLIENFFAKLKQFRAIATRYDMTARTSLPRSISLLSRFCSIDDTP